MNLTFPKFGQNHPVRFGTAPANQANMPLSQLAASDKVNFSGAKSGDLDANQKLEAYAKQILQTINNGQPLKKGQKLQLTAESKYLPLIRKIAEAAYQDGSGKVNVKIIEPELEALKQKYNITEQFEYKQLAKDELQKQGAAFLKLDNTTSEYEKAGLSNDEIKQVTASINPPMTDELRQALDINPDELLFEALDLRAGQPIRIAGQREHLPQIVKLVERAYQNGSKLVDVTIMEDKEFDPDIPMFQYASEETLKEVPQSVIDMWKEIHAKNVARLFLEGDDPEHNAGLDSKRIQLNSSTRRKAIKSYWAPTISDNPWTIYYLPTRKSAKAAGYPDSNEGLLLAAKEANMINHRGKLGEHVKKLEILKNKMNDIIKQGYKNLHFISEDDNGEKTNLIVGLSDKSTFASARLKTTRGQSSMANIPSEETFTTPDATKTRGHVTSTMPLAYNGLLIDGIKVEFDENGRIAKDPNGKFKASATENEDTFLGMIGQENADRLGEVALVAGSPIFDLGRIFKSTLQDENATCHIAVGSAYSECVEGADKITDQDEKKKYMDSVNANDSPEHVDFMIGGPNVAVYAENPDNPEDKKLLIKDNKFQI